MLAECGAWGNNVKGLCHLKYVPCHACVLLRSLYCVWCAGPSFPCQGAARTPDLQIGDLKSLLQRGHQSQLQHAPHRVTVAG